MVAVVNRFRKKVFIDNHLQLRYNIREVIHVPEFGDNLKKTRKAARLSQVELARKTGLSKSTICNYESGKRIKPSIPIVQAIAAVLNVPWWVLMGWEDYGGGFDGKEAPQEMQNKLLDNFRKHHPEWRDVETAPIGMDSLHEQLNTHFDMLNEPGQQEAVKRVGELAEIPRYRK